MVQEEPLAIWCSAFANSGAIFGSKKLGRRLCDRPEDAVQKIVSVGLPFPAIIAICPRQFAVLQGLQRKIVDLLNICRTGMSARGDGGEGVIKDFAKVDGFAKCTSRCGMIAAGASP